MRFSWSGVVLAPLLLPLLCGLFAVVIAFSPHGPLASFLFLFIPAGVVSYGTMIFLFLPSLYALAKLVPLTFVRVCLIGAVLGAMWTVPLMWAAWLSSGPDSGPPEDTFWRFLVQWVLDPGIVLFALFPLSGAITTALYCAFAPRPSAE